MSAQGLVQLLLLFVALAVTVPPLGRYMAKVYGSTESAEGGPAPAPGDRVFLPVERFIYRLLGVNERKEQRWNVYAVSLLAFSILSLLLTYLILRIQGSLPLNPTDREGVPAYGAWNAAVSFMTNTNWQWYSGEQSMSHLSQMVALAVQNFVSAAAGMAVAVAIIRGIMRRKGRSLGNFWVDLTRGVLRILLPISFVAAVVLMGVGVVQNLSGETTATTLDASVTATVTAEDGTESEVPVTEQAVPGGPAASQIAIKQLGTNGGGFFNVNSAHPLENPNGWSNLVEMFLILLIPLAFPVMFGRMLGQPRQGWVLLGVMASILVASIFLASFAETGGNPDVAALGVDQSSSSVQGGGNMEGKDVRFGASTCAQWAGATTGTSNGSVNCMHDSMTPAGGGVVMLQMKLGEVSPGGVGVGLMGILINALLAVFIAGLMVGRTPEYLGKKIQASEMKLVVLYIVAMPVAVLVPAAISVVLPSALTSILNPGAHGLSEVLYAYASAGNNNGSAFGGLSTGTDWYTITQGFSMLIGRFFLIIPALALGGSMVRKNQTPATSGTFPTDSPLFFWLLTGVILIVAGLTFFPALALGPIVEQLSMIGG
jgi:K+-transporting ATPase ATPase A chain